MSPSKAQAATIAASALRAPPVAKPAPARRRLGPGPASRPMLVVVLKDCVTDTKVTPCASITSTSLAKSISERLSLSIL